MDERIYEGLKMDEFVEDCIEEWDEDGYDPEELGPWSLDAMLSLEEVE